MTPAELEAMKKTMLSGGKESILTRSSSGSDGYPVGQFV
jgi:hypothetical protein